MTTPASAAKTRVVPVALGERSYDVVIGAGLFASAADEIARRLGRRRMAIVTDATVARHHLPPLEAALAARGLHAGTLALPAGEATKSFAVLTHVCDRLLAFGLERSDLVIALGGGVIGDLAGFAAAILRRGVRFVQVPTTLLAQVDSSVGGKTGINTVQGKNLVGAFHQPALVLADPATLATLPDRQMRAGYAEVVKYGLLGDADFYAWLERHGRDVLAREADALANAVAHSVAMKAAIVGRDETETGERMLLNLGHTFGHALESWAGYSDRLLHGEAVAIGMCLAFRLSERLGLAPPQTAARVAAHLKAAGLATRIGDIAGGQPACDELLHLMAQDKKKRDGRLTLILAEGIGRAIVSREVGEAAIAAFLAEEIARPAEG
jgi:3-dehydroquinate synthase